MGTLDSDYDISSDSDYDILSDSDHDISGTPDSDYDISDMSGQKTMLHSLRKVKLNMTRVQQPT